MSIVYITMEWRGQQHAREAVESTASSATSTMQAMSSTPQPGSDKEGYGRAYASLIKASKELSFPIKQELKAVSTATTSTKYYQVFTQVFPKPATV